MTDQSEDGTPSAPAPQMTHLVDVACLVAVAKESTVSRTVLKGQGARLVLFAFDAGQELTEHTAAVPVLLQVLDGRLSVTAGGTVADLRPGGVVHLPARMPHSVVAPVPARMLLTMLDPRLHA